MWGDDDYGVVADGALTAEAHEVVTRVEDARRASLSPAKAPGGDIGTDDDDDAGVDDGVDDGIVGDGVIAIDGSPGDRDVRRASMSDAYEDARSTLEPESPARSEETSGLWGSDDDFVYNTESESDYDDDSDYDYDSDDDVQVTQEIDSQEIEEQLQATQLEPPSQFEDVEETQEGDDAMEDVVVVSAPARAEQNPIAPVVLLPAVAPPPASSENDGAEDDLIAQLRALTEKVAAQLGRSVDEVNDEVGRRPGATRRAIAANRQRDDDDEFDIPAVNVRRPYRRRAPTIVPGQRTLDAFIQRGGGVRARDDTADVQVMRRPVRRRRMDIPRPPIPENEEALYELWETTAKQLVPENASAYSNFLYAFGDHTIEGVAHRRQEMMAVCKMLFEYRRTRKPLQPMILKGREREGKSVALFSIALAALLSDMRVVILCAPNKVAPIVDMVSKLEKAGFSKMFNTRHTLSSKMAADNGIDCPQAGAIFVAALGTMGDLKKVDSFIKGERREGKLTVTLMDECDEITQGKGCQNLLVAHDCDPDTYQEYIPEPLRGEDDYDAAFVESGSRDAKRRKNKNQIATACKFVKEKLFPSSQIVACSATLSGFILTPIGVFYNDRVTEILKVWPKPGFTGIERFEIPQGCELDIDGSMSVDAFEESDAVQRMLHRFYKRQNHCDNTQLAPIPGTGANPVTLRGMLFVSVSSKVNVSGGVRDFADIICSMTNMWCDGTDANKTLFICYVGAPIVFFAGQWKKAQKGATVEDIYNDMANRTRRGVFAGVRLEDDAPFSSVCSHCVVIGYNLTRRAMTAAFTPKDELNVLCKLQYVIFTAPKKLTIDSVSQRITRASHDFALHVVPSEYSVDVAIRSELLDLLKEYRRLEDKMVETQREGRAIHSIFRQQIYLYDSDLSGVKVSKRGILLEELSATGRKKHWREQCEADVDQNEYLIGFKEYLDSYSYGPNHESYTESTIKQYYRDIRGWFVSHAEIDRVIECVKEDIERLEGDTNLDKSFVNKLNASRRFLEYYDKEVAPA